MNRTQKILVGAALPAILADGVVAGVAFAQMPDDHHRDEATGMQMGQMMDPAAMQDHMKNVLGDDGRQRMFNAMGDHAAGMPMDMSDMDGMMAAMEGYLGLGGALPPGAPGAGQHDEHHPAPTSG